jgi:PST family polysaccharide transporter
MSDPSQDTGDGLRDKAVRGVAWSAVRNWGSRAINFVVFAVLANLLATEAFGLVSLAGAYIAFVRVFVDQGFADAIIQRDELKDAHRDTAFWVNLGLSVVFTGASIAAAPWIAQLFDAPDLAGVIIWLSPSFVLAALAGVQEALFERNLDYQTLAVREFVAALVGGAVGVTMAFTGYGVYSLVGMLLAERTAAVVVLWTASPWRPGGRVRMQPFRDLFAFGINVVGSNVLGYVNRRADNLIIGYALGTGPLGFYEIAYQLFMAGTHLITNAVSSVAFSTFSRMQGDPARMRQGFYTATHMVCLVAFPAFFGAALVAPELIGTVFGEKWLPLSAQTFQVLAFVGVLHAAFYFNAAVMMASGKPQWRLMIGIVNAVTNVVAFALVVQWGIVAVAAAFVLQSYLFAPLPLILVRRLIHIEWTAYFSAYGPPLLGTLAIAAVVQGVKWGLAGAGGDIAVLAISIPLSAVAYVATIALVAPKRLKQVQGLMTRIITP